MRGESGHTSNPFRRDNTKYSIPLLASAHLDKSLLRKLKTLPPARYISGNITNFRCCADIGMAAQNPASPTSPGLIPCDRPNENEPADRPHGTSHELQPVVQGRVEQLDGPGPVTEPATEATGLNTEKSSHKIDDQTSRLPFRRLLSAYLCLAAIYFISTLDINSTATALPTISRSLNAGSSITWTATAYLMGQTAFQALYGRLSDIFGRKPVLLVSIGFLILGDVLCGFARNVTWLYVCRALSGVGGGGISSLVQITVSDLVSLRDRGKYQGMLSGAIGLGASTGPFIAASVLDRGGDDEESWRWIFWIPPILAAACMVVMWIYLPLKPVTGSWRAKIGKIDWSGLCAAVAAILFLLVSDHDLRTVLRHSYIQTLQIPINSGGSIWPWHSALIITMLVLGGVFIAIFVVIEKRFSRLPLIPLRLFTQASTAAIFLQSGLYNCVWQVDLYFLPIYFQDVRGYSPLQSASLTLPLLLFQSIAGVASGPLMSRLAR
jgi:MFS family permease